MRDQYLAQVRLLLDVLPLVGRQKEFALKGGTALNFFLHDMPRLSVDIDLQYLPVTPYNDARQNMHAKMEILRADIGKAFPAAQCQYDAKHYRILVRHRGVDIKIETNDVIRGYVYEPEQYQLSPEVADYFGAALDFNCLNRADLYAGKLCAALDRQHPRDLFDIHYLLNKTGVFQREIIVAFVVYLAGSKKSIHELLDPRPQAIQEMYQKKFDGMADNGIGLAELQNLQSQLPGIVRGALTEADKQFLLSFKRGSPEWGVLPIDHAKDLPAVKWKMHNLNRMDDRKRQQAIQKLEDVLA